MLNNKIEVKNIKPDHLQWLGRAVNFLFAVYQDANKKDELNLLKRSILISLFHKLQKKASLLTKKMSLKFSVHEAKVLLESILEYEYIDKSAIMYNIKEQLDQQLL